MSLSPSASRYERPVPADFEPDYRHLVAAARNQRPGRLPFYEHHIGVDTMEAMLGRALMPLLEGGEANRRAFFSTYSGFFRDHGYDTVSFEQGVVPLLPGGGALQGGVTGAIQNRRDFEKYPWRELPELFWKAARPRLDALCATLPPGMKMVGGVGFGLFEIVQDLTGFETLCLMQADDPELFDDLFRAVGELLYGLWDRMLADYGEMICICRVGDDMGFKTSTLLSPDTFRRHSIPHYRRIIARVHEAGKPFLMHSCGRIFALMDDLIDAGIDAKHSNEDAVAPYDEWIRRYGDRIGLFGGIDCDRLCRMAPDDIYAFVLEQATRFRNTARGYALGSGNSIPGYVPPEGFLAMLRAGAEIRRREGTC